MPRGLGVPLVAHVPIEKGRDPHEFPGFFLSFNLYPLRVRLRYLRCAQVSFASYTTMGVTEFPRIKEIRTFVIDGVGSGGDYHNVQKHLRLNKEMRMLILCVGQGRPLAH